jgi:hypothetical protein
MQDSGVHSARVCLARYVPPSGFGYPPDGLLPPGPRRPFFVPTALLGFALRSFPLSEGIPGVSARDEPTCRSACRCSLGQVLGPDRHAPTTGL